jgi:hypothetical protein
VARQHEQVEEAQHRQGAADDQGVQRRPPARDPRRQEPARQAGRRVVRQQQEEPPRRHGRQELLQRLGVAGIDSFRQREDGQADPL